jgi:hypothetical protein
MPSHAHNSASGRLVGMFSGCEGMTANIGMGNSGATGGGGSHDHTLSANFIGNATSVLQPYLTLIYIIKT